MPASARAARLASSARSQAVRLPLRTNGVWPTPTIATWRWIKPRAESVAGVDSTWVESVPQRVGEIVQAQQQHRQHDARPNRHPRVDAQVRAAAIEHCTPGRLRRLRAQTKERKACLGK